MGQSWPTRLSGTITSSLPTRKGTGLGGRPGSHRCRERAASVPPGLQEVHHSLSEGVGVLHRGKMPRAIQMGFLQLR